MRVPTRSAGTRSGVNWMPHERAAHHGGQRLDGQRLGQARARPPAGSGPGRAGTRSSARSSRSWPTMTRLTSNSASSRGLPSPPRGGIFCHQVRIRNPSGALRSGRLLHGQGTPRPGGDVVRPGTSTVTHGRHTTGAAVTNHEGHPAYPTDPGGVATAPPIEGTSYPPSYPPLGDPISPPPAEPPRQKGSGGWRLPAAIVLAAALLAGGYGLGRVVDDDGGTSASSEPSGSVQIDPESRPSEAPLPDTGEEPVAQVAAAPLAGRGADRGRTGAGLGCHLRPQRAHPHRGARRGRRRPGGRAVGGWSSGRRRSGRGEPRDRHRRRLDRPGGRHAGRHAGRGAGQGRRAGRGRRQPLRSRPDRHRGRGRARSTGRSRRRAAAW